MIKDEHIYSWHKLKKSWKYQRLRRGSNFEKARQSNGQENDKITNNYLQNTTYETKDWATSNPQKIQSG